VSLTIQYQNVMKMQILGELRRRDGCGNREEVAPTMPDGDDWADDDMVRAEDTFRSGGRALALTA
jgi:hypothetical protein